MTLGDNPASSLRGRRRAWLLRLLPFALLLVSAAACDVQSPAATPGAAGHRPAATEIRLIITRDFGAVRMHDEVVPSRGEQDVMTLLAQQAQVETNYGGKFVNAVDGVRSTYGGVVSGDPADWFYWVDGAMADVGAADYELKGGETVWWDYHEWVGAMSIPATLSAFPSPWAGEPLDVISAQAWPGLDEWAEENGLQLGDARPLSDPPSSGGLVIATAAQAAATPWLSGRLAGNEGMDLVRLDSHGLSLMSSSADAGPAAQAVALAMPGDADGELLLIMIVESPATAERLFTLLTPDAVAGHVAMAVADDELATLPWRKQ
ncbi:MAG: DUF4430 domain-containing protein [Thermoleophilia bacterium]